MTDDIDSRSNGAEIGYAPRVSVVMPTYQRAPFIGETIRTLRSSQFTDFELLVRDDGNGSDGTEDAVALAAEGDRRISYYRNTRRLGMPGNLNAGIAAARGSMIAVCHDHDLYSTRFLSMMLDTLARHPSAAFVHCAIEAVDQHGVSVAMPASNWPELSNGREWLRFMLNRLDCPVCALAVVRRDAHEVWGLYDEQYKFISDVEMWMRLSLHADVAYVRTPLIKVRTREVNHAAHSQSFTFARTLRKIHHRYIDLAYPRSSRIAKRLGLEWRIARHVATLAAAKPTRLFGS